MSRGLIYGGQRNSPSREDRELIPFSNAVPGVYEQIMGTSLSPFGGLLIDALLNEVAQSMADLVTIYGATNFQEPLRPLPWAEVKLGVFQRGATVIRTSDGVDHRRLYIRRGDVRVAAAVLKKSGVRFARIKENLGHFGSVYRSAVGGETGAGVVQAIRLT